MGRANLVFVYPVLMFRAVVSGPNHIFAMVPYFGKRAVTADACVPVIGAFLIFHFLGWLVLCIHEGYLFRIHLHG